MESTVSGFVSGVLTILKSAFSSPLALFLCTILLLFAVILSQSHNRQGIVRRKSASVRLDTSVVVAFVVFVIVVLVVGRAVLAWW